MRKRGQTWEPGRIAGTDASGRKEYIRRSFRGRKREADRELARLVVEADDRGTTVAELLEHFWRRGCLPRWDAPAWAAISN